MRRRIMACVPKYKGQIYNSLSELKSVIADELSKESLSNKQFEEKMKNMPLIDKQGFSSYANKLEYLSEMVPGYSEMDMEGESLIELCK